MFHPTQVSDFGMSATLAGSNSDYAANYIKVQGELPVRWASIEVLQSGKFSRASDVWAFGVLVHEVMSRGRSPYLELANLAEVAEQIKAGKLLQCPRECRQEIYDGVMLPCWAREASARPGFHELCGVLVRLGATPAVDTSEPTADAIAVFEEETQTDQAWKSGLGDRSLLGVSVAHLISLAPRVVAAVASPWTDSRGKAVETPISATIFHMVSAVAKPASAQTVCPRDGELGCAYVDTLSDRNNVGKATALLSCEF
jgi:serine/threonine protein kinase